jgi:hypothetical protein
VTNSVAVNSTRRAVATAARLAGAALLGATAAIHLKLYVDGYRDIPTM